MSAPLRSRFAGLLPAGLRFDGAPFDDVQVETDPRERRLLIAELVVVLAATFGLSGLRSLMSLTRALLDPRPLGEQSTTLNASQSALGWLDAAYQLVGVVQLLAWAGLPVVLLLRSGVGVQAMGLARERIGPALGWGLALAALIGIPGLALYLGAVELGANRQVAASGLTTTWWRPIALTLSAAANGAAEEILVVAYLLLRLRRLGWPLAAAVAASAVLRGSYHLYQGFGGGLGNLVMGVVFALWFVRTRRTWPLVVAHTTLDVVAFVGYALLAPHVPWL